MTATVVRSWSAQQEIIFESFERGRGHRVVRARAGTGKTTTILTGVSRAPERSITLCAFGTRNKEDLETKLREQGIVSAVQVQTIHAMGLGAVRRWWDRIRVQDKNAPVKRADQLTEAVCGTQAPDKLKRLVSILHTKAREITPHATEVGQLTDLAYQFECVPDDEWQQSGFDVAWLEKRALEAMDLAAKRKPVSGIDFADMIFLPVRNRWLRPAKDMVVVDEAQDMTEAQLEIALGVCSGRVFIVGDDRQGIFGFRGADSSSLDKLKARLHAEELGLTVTYRCGKAIVALAKQLVPDFEAAPSAPEGKVSTIPIERLALDVELGDFILSRKNAPLTSVAMSLIRQQKRVKVAGKDIGDGLARIVDRLTKGKGKDSIPQVLDKLVHWEERETARALAAGREDQVEDVHDKAETLRVLIDGVTGAPELLARIEGLFTDNGLGAAGIVTCSSVHKAKGLEADQVFVLRDTLGQGVGKKGKPLTPAQELEEQNIEYVAITRAKESLVWVDGLPGERA